MSTSEEIKLPIRKAHYVGNSVVLTIDPTHVKRLEIDDFTYFLQRPTANGILLEKRRLSTGIAVEVGDNERK
jgi:hypothetical protein